MAGHCDSASLWQAIREIGDELAGGATDGMAIVVHYSGYGYDPGGAPAWLARALERRPPRFRDARIVTMFHELYVTGWPWQRAFWTSPRQRIVANRVARASDAVMTNREQSACWLEKVTGTRAGSVRSLPVTSNVGEPDEILPWNVRAPQAVIFGSIRFKRPFLGARGAQRAAAFCQKLEIRKLVIIGERATTVDTAFRRCGIDVIQTDYLSASEISGHFGIARVALVDYFPQYYAKSGVLAAAAAHGTPPIFPRSGKASDGLEFGEHLWDVQSALAADARDTSARLAAMSQSIRSWYDNHKSGRHAALLAELALPTTVGQVSRQ